MGLGDIYELTFKQRLFGQAVYNVFFYREGEAFVTTTPTHAEVLATNWWDYFEGKVNGIQSADVSYEQVSVRNLYDGADSYNLSVSGHGLPDLDPSETDTDSAFAAVAFGLFGETLAVKQGAKRFAGVNEAYTTDGVVTGAPFIANCVTMQTALATPIQVGLVLPSDVFFPVLVKRIRSGSAGDYEYRLPENAGEGVYTAVISALLDVVISSQVSRKIGRGI